MEVISWSSHNNGFKGTWGNKSGVTLVRTRHYQVWRLNNIGVSVRGENGKEKGPIILDLIKGDILCS